MKITKSRIKEIITEEINKLTEAKRWKVYIKGEKKPFILTGTDKNSVKQLINIGFGRK